MSGCAGGRVLNQAHPVRDRESLLQAAAVKVLAIPLEDARGEIDKAGADRR